MTFIEHFFDPKRLWLVWQPALTALGVARTRRIVAEITHDNDIYTFRYLTDSADFKSARAEGFEGYPAFRVSENEYHNNVLATFTRRLPPRKREDFSEYLAAHRLPSTFSGSDMALLAYTGAKLPSDSFELVPDLSDSKLPLQIIMEVAGYRYHKKEGLKENDTVKFSFDKDNPYDTNAIAITHSGQKIGYICRPFLSIMKKWLHTAHVYAKIERLNGKPERPVVYLFVSVHPV
jgi:hypothetical protein